MQFGVSHPCAGDQGFAGDAIDVLIEGQNFYGTPTYIIICPDYKMHFDVCFPPHMNCFDDYIQNCNNALVADFQVESTQVCEGAQVQFSDQSQGNILVWEWHFEGGNPESSGEINPIVTYDQPGIWNVSLKVSNDLYSDSLTVQGFIEVTANPEVTLQPFDEVCIDAPPFILTGGTPEGGIYTGTGVELGWFYPQVAGEGEHLITYTYEDGNGCVDFAEQMIVVEICTSVDVITNDVFEIYPNPSTGELFISHEISGEAAIELFDLVGNKVFASTRQLFANVPHQLDLRHLDAGLYLLRISAGEQTVTLKITLSSK